MMVVDDSAVIRGLLSRVLESDPRVKIVASVSNGQMALASLSRDEIDVAVLDIEMPVMDGLTALPKMVELKPDLQIIMASSLTRSNAEISMKALRLGAADCIAKPSSTAELHSADDFKRDLVQKVLALAGAKRRLRSAKSSAPAAPRLDAKVAASPQKISLRVATTHVPQAIAIASSTGGPQALLQVIGNLGENLRQPVLITQHMPATFTALLAEHISRTTEMPCREGSHGEIVQGGTIYVAPGGRHMEVVHKLGQTTIRLTDEPPENFCRPAADPMFRSLAKVYGRQLCAIVLTGMGSDGLAGAEAIVSAGGTVIAQDQETSVVWGMPGAVATAGLCSAVMPLSEIAPYIRNLAMRPAA